MKRVHTSPLTDLTPTGEEHKNQSGGGLNDFLFNHAVELHRHLSCKYADCGGLLGPDQYPFTKEAWPLLPLYPVYHLLSAMGILSYPRYRHVQAQAYWILANLFLHKKLGSQVFLDLAMHAGDNLTLGQLADGSWRYVAPGWRKRVSTVYCTWGALSLVKLHSYTGRKEYLQAALKWKECLTNKVGLERRAVNNSQIELISYFSPPISVMVPNASTLTLAFLSNLEGYLSEEDRGLISKLVESTSFLQLSSGEIPYSTGRRHYICPAYNGWEFIDLYEFARNTQSNRITIMLRKLADYLTSQIRLDGSVNHDCTHQYPQVYYHTLAVACALHYAHLMFHDVTYLRARNRILWGYFYRRRGLGFREFARFKAKSLDLPYLALFARQASYILVCLLRIALVNDVNFLGDSLC